MKAEAPGNALYGRSQTSSQAGKVTRRRATPERRGATTNAIKRITRTATTEPDGPKTGTPTLLVHVPMEPDRHLTSSPVRTRRAAWNRAENRQGQLPGARNDWVSTQNHPRPLRRNYARGMDRPGSGSGQALSVQESRKEPRRPRHGRPRRQRRAPDSPSNERHTESLRRLTTHNGSGRVRPIRWTERRQDDPRSHARQEHWDNVANQAHRHTLERGGLHEDLVTATTDQQHRQSWSAGRSGSLHQSHDCQSKRARRREWT